MKFPKEEKYELASQLQRAALSVPLNIVEGCGRYTDKDFVHFPDNALGSLNETDYCCFAASELNYITIEKYGIVNKFINKTRGMLNPFSLHLIPSTLYLTLYHKLNNSNIP